MKVSYCTGCLGRLHYLQYTLPANLGMTQGEQVEFVLLSYDDQPLDAWVRRHWMSEIQGGRLVYARLLGRRSFYHHAHAKNVAHRLASGDVLCNLDAENFVLPGVTRAIAGTVRASPRSIVRFSRYHFDAVGQIAVARAGYADVAGYDEEFVGYGYEDVNFVDRLEMLGYRSVEMPEELAHTLHHENSERMAHDKQRGGDLEAAMARARELREWKKAAARPIANPGGYGRGRVLVNFEKEFDL